MGGMEQLEEQGIHMAYRSLSILVLLHSIRACGAVRACVGLGAHRKGYVSVLSRGNLSGQGHLIGRLEYTTHHNVSHCSQYV
jgi:hypothetical protein